MFKLMYVMDQNHLIDILLSMEAPDSEMVEADMELERLSSEDLILMCSDAFENISMEENIEELEKEVQTLFIPQLEEKISTVRDQPELYLAMAKNLTRCYIFLQLHEKSVHMCKDIETFLLQSIPKGANPFTEQRNKIDAELSGTYVNLASIHSQQNDHGAALEYFQKASDRLLPWIFEESDMSPVPNLLSIATHRILSCVDQKNWKMLKDDIQTVASVHDIIFQLQEICEKQFELGLNTLIFAIKVKRTEFARNLKEHVPADLMQQIMNANPDIEFDEEEMAWVTSIYAEQNKKE